MPEPVSPLDDVDLALLPKVSLHDHLDGGLRPETVLELAGEAGVETPANDREGLLAWVGANTHSGDLVDYLRSFALTTAVLQTAGALERVAREAVADLVADGVVYAELRWAPEQHGERGLAADAAVEAVQAGIEAGVAAAAADGREIVVRQLVSAMRQADNGLEAARLALRHRERGVAGFDIAGPEDGFPPSRLADAFDLLAREFLPVTVHAGEAAGLESIRGALLDARALRLGHGVRIAEDIEIAGRGRDATAVRLGPLARWVRDRGIPLETSPSSNLQTGAVAAWGERMEDHPFDLLHRLGFRVTVNTDNRLVSGTTLSREIGLLARAFDYGLEDVLAFQLAAAEAAFLPLEERAALSVRIADGFAALG